MEIKPTGAGGANSNTGVGQTGRPDRSSVSIRMKQVQLRSQ